MAAYCLCSYQLVSVWVDTHAWDTVIIGFYAPAGRGDYCIGVRALPLACMRAPVCNGRRSTLPLQEGPVLVA